MKLSRCCLSVLSFVLVIIVQQAHTSNDNDYQTQYQHPSGIISVLLTPLRTVIRHARRLLVDRPTRTIDKVQLEVYKIFMRLYNKTYSPEEIPRRMALFFQRRKEIEESVKAFAEGRLPFMMRENAFLDWDERELKTLTGARPPVSPNDLLPEEDGINLDDHEPNNSAPFKEDVDIEDSFSYEDDDGLMNLTVKAEKIPAKKDWRKSGCVSAPIDQHKCGACYAIATMGAVESVHCINQVSAPNLGPQQVVDCSSSYNNHGCDGGWPTKVLRYLQDVKIAARESCYPFVRRKKTCQLHQVRAKSGCTVSASPTGTRLRFKVLSNEQDILYHVAKTGPVVTVLKATDKFLYFGSGVFDDKTCSRRRSDVDHAILIIGYGRENGQDYWLIKNSWGTTSWGEEGYGKVRRGKRACSIGHWGWVIVS